MKKVFLTGIAALLLTMGSARAEAAEKVIPDDAWADTPRCQALKRSTGGRNVPIPDNCEVGMADVPKKPRLARAAEPKVRMWYCPHERSPTNVQWTGPAFKGGPETVSVKTGGAEVGNARVSLTKRGAYFNGRRCRRDVVMECTAAREARGESPEGCGE